MMEEEDEELEVTNKFANDGSFFEKFKQMQEQQKAKEKEASKTDEDSCSAKRRKG